MSRTAQGDPPCTWGCGATLAREAERLDTSAAAALVRVASLLAAAAGRA